MQMYSIHYSTKHASLNKKHLIRTYGLDFLAYHGWVFIARSSAPFCSIHLYHNSIRKRLLLYVKESRLEKTSIYFSMTVPQGYICAAK